MLKIIKIGALVLACGIALSAAADCGGGGGNCGPQCPPYHPSAVTPIGSPLWALSVAFLS
jgi:hypothetical protein